jgi:hypothetical protein
MNAKHTFIILFLTLCVGQLLAACGAAAPADPAAIAQNFYAALNEGDVDTAMTFVSEDVQCRGACYLNGIESFRAYIQGGVNANGKTEISDLKVEGDTVAYHWIAYTKEGFLDAQGEETLNIKDGKIILMDTQPFQ